MIKKLFLLLSTMLSVTILYSGCTTTSNKNESSSKEKIITYAEYKDLYKDLIKDFKLKNLNKIEFSDDTNIVAINKEDSFGKRQYLTLKGNQSADLTQKRITYSDKDSKYIVYIDIIYLNRILDNDLVYFNTTKSDYFDKDTFVNKFDDAIVSFKNILFKVTLFCKTDESAASTNIVTDTVHSLTGYLKSYKN